MPKLDSTPDLTELVNKLDALRKLQVKLQTEKDIILKRKVKLLEKLKLVNIPEDLTGYIVGLTKTLTEDLAKIKIPEDIENELREFRSSSDQ